MAIQTGFKNRFNSGELAEAAWSNSDLQQHANGVALGRNFIGRPLGPLQRRPGFWWLGTTALPNFASRPIPFVRSVDDAFMIELGNHYMRVRRADGSFFDVEIIAPFSEADLPGLRWQQSGDMLLFFHRDGRRPKRLLRLTADATQWSWADYQFVNGPWRAENPDESFTIGVSDISGTGVTITASRDLFEAGMIGTQFRLRAATGTPGIKTWAADWDPVDYELANSNGRIYRCSDIAGSTKKTGNTPPIHDRGTVTDGVLPWTYIHDGAGIVQITDVISPTTALGNVIRTLPTTGDASHNLPALSGVPFPDTSFWAEAAYSDYRGWPTAWPDFREERLVVGGSRSEPDKFDATRTAGFDTEKADFTPGLGTGRVVDDDAVRNFCGDVSAKLVWLVSMARLLAGTHATENAIGGGTLDDPLTPSTARARTLSGFGSSEAGPARAGDAILYITRGGTLRELMVASDLSSANSDLSLMASHLVERGFVELAWTGEPDNILWVRLADGGLASFVYHREQRVFGWYSHELGGDWKVEGLASLPAQDGRDALWVHVYRQKDGQPQRGVMMLSAAGEGLRLDAAERYEGTVVNAVTGLTHLEGEKVTARARTGAGGWVEYDGLMVEGSAVTLPDPVGFSEIIIGKPYLSRFESLPADLLGPATSQGRKQRVTNMTIIARGVTGRAGVRIDEQDRRFDVFSKRDPDETTGIVERRLVFDVPVEANVSDDPRLVIECDNSFDLVIYALKPKELVNG
jgi:hypothetical protein